MLCTHCDKNMPMTREITDNSRGGETLRTYVCACGSRTETRQPRHQAEVVLYTTEPSADTKQRETAQMEREAAGHEAFLSAGGRRHVR